MPKAQQTSLSRSVLIRQGEGVGLDVVQHHVQVSGQSVAEISVDASRAPVPDRKYVADFAGVDEFKGNIRLLFGQRKIGTEQLRSLIVIHLSRNGVMHLLHSMERMDSPTYEEIVEKTGIEVIALDPVPEEPQQTVSLAANVTLSAMSGDEVCLDFYRASPFSQRSAEHGGKFYIDPVVRIDLPSGMFISLMRELKQRQEAVAKRVLKE
jgi:hypothetical protein